MSYVIYKDANYYKKISNLKDYFKLIPKSRGTLVLYKLDGVTVKHLFTYNKLLGFDVADFDTLFMYYLQDL